VKPALVVAALAAVAGAAMGCTGDLDQPWQLDHDRIVAVRATPPGIAPGEQSTIDALLGAKGGPTRVAAPEAATVVSPASLSDVLRFDGGRWVITAPGEDRLIAARAELHLEAGALVPLQVGVSYAGMSLVATKRIDLGASASNPSLTTMHMTIDGQRVGDQPPAPSEIVVQPLVKVPLSIDADDTLFDVTWLTSCGTMHDFDLPSGYLKVEADDPQTGELAVVLRDDHAGVAWAVWPIRAE
jgi:hypothetical protein